MSIYFLPKNSQKRIKFNKNQLLLHSVKCKDLITNSKDNIEIGTKKNPLLITLTSRECYAYRSILDNRYGIDLTALEYEHIMNEMGSDLNKFYTVNCVVESSNDEEDLYDLMDPKTKEMGDYRDFFQNLRAKKFRIRLEFGINDVIPMKIAFIECGNPYGITTSDLGEIVWPNLKEIITDNSDRMCFYGLTKFYIIDYRANVIEFKTYSTPLDKKHLFSSTKPKKLIYSINIPSVYEINLKKVFNDLVIFYDNLRNTNFYRGWGV